MCGANLFNVEGNGSFRVYGQPNQMSHFVWYPAVQEEPVRLNGTPVVNSTVFNLNYSPLTTKIINLSYVEFDLQGSRQNLINGGYSYDAPGLTLTDCRLYDAYFSISSYTVSGSIYSAVTLANDLWERCSLSLFNGWTSYYGTIQNPLTVTLYNNTFWSNTIALSYMDASATYHPAWTIADNLFDSCSISFTGNGNYLAEVNRSNNGYYPSASTRLGETIYVSLSSLTYATGLLGNRYIDINNTSPSLVNAGSRSATDASLSEYTIQANQAHDEGYVDIGFHYWTQIIRPGFDQNSLAPSDDDGYGSGSEGGLIDNLLADIGFSINLFDTTYSSLYVNDNGNVTFGDYFGGTESYSWYVPGTTLADLGSLGYFDFTDIIAPFWADVDTRAAGSPLVTYGTGTVDGHAAFGVNWIGVGYWVDHDADQMSCKTNSFQLVLIDRSDIATGDFDMEFNYTEIQWEAGNASSGNDGLWETTSCDTPDYNGPARVGYASYRGLTTYTFEMTGSGMSGALLDSNQTTGLIHNSFNSTRPGRYVFHFRDGAPAELP